jgi:acetylglutamate synthase
MIIYNYRTERQLTTCSPTNPIKEKPSMEIPMELSLEQQFMLNVYKQQVKELSQEQAQQYLLEVLRQMMVKENMFKHLLKHA